MLSGDPNILLFIGTLVVVIIYVISEYTKGED